MPPFGANPTTGTTQVFSRCLIRGTLTTTIDLSMVHPDANSFMTLLLDVSGQPSCTRGQRYRASGAVNPAATVSSTMALLPYNKKTFIDMCETMQVRFTDYDWNRVGHATAPSCKRYSSIAAVTSRPCHCSGMCQSLGNSLHLVVGQRGSGTNM